MNQLDPSEEVFRLVTAAAKYAALDEGFVRRLIDGELGKGRKPREAAREVRARLHQTGAVFLERQPDFDASLAELRLAKARGDTAWRTACRAAMALHTSTHERLPILEDFYPRCLEGLGPIESLTDLACGLNPLALPWMGLPHAVHYQAVDIHLSLLAFLNRFFTLAGYDNARALPGDLTQANQLRGLACADVALALKTLPSLEQSARGAALRLLELVPARWLVISFPLGSLGGRRRGRREHYSAQFQRWAASQSWHIEELVFPGELVYRIRKHPAPTSM